MEAEDSHLPRLRSGHPALPDLLERRLRVSPNPDRGAAREDWIGGVRCLLVSAGTASRTILYFHGGGYRMGCPEAWVSYATRLAETADAQIVMPAYRLAPENPYPAALHDAVAVYKVLAQHDSVIVAGDSAGGGLAAALCLVAAKMGRAPAGAILVSPLLELDAIDETYESRALTDPYISRESVEEIAAAYLQEHPRDDPLVSPLRADPTLFPPMLLLVGSAETLLGDTLTFARRLALANNRVTLHVAANAGHVWPMLMPQTPEADDAISVMAGFARTISR